jgi:ribosomal protein L29
MLAVTTYDDAPIARLVSEEPLENLLPQLQALLTELEQSLAIRQMQWQQRRKKQTRKPVSPRPQTTTSHPTPTVSSTQITLF